MIHYSYLLYLALSLFIFIKFDFFAKKINFYDYAQSHKIHTSKKPLIGSIFFVLSIAVIILVAFFDQRFFFEKIFFSNNRSIWFFVLSIILIFSIGFVDDKTSVSPGKRLISFFAIIYFNMMADSSLILSPIIIASINFYIDLAELALPITLIIIVGFLNAVNFMDGINLNFSLYSIFVLLFFIFSGLLVNLNYFMLIAILFFSILNYNNKTFFGNAGVYSFSFILIYQLIKYHNSLIFNFETCVVISFLPFIEIVRLTISRLFLGLNPFNPDLNHLHHILLKKLNQTMVNFIYIIFYSLLLFMYFVLKVQFDLLIILYLSFSYLIVVFYFKSKFI